LSDAAQITLSGSTDANLDDPTGTGTFTGLNVDPPATYGLEAVNFVGAPVFDFEKRSVVEFNNSVLPTNAIINSVTFNFRVASYANNQFGVGVSAYAGTGTITLADATAAATQVGTYQSDALTEFHVGLSSTTFQSLLSSSSYFALRLAGLEQTVNTSIFGIEGNSQSLAPSLTISYSVASVPEPGGLTLGCVAAISLAGLRFMSKGRKRGQIDVGA
jgi:hypothetical protein